MGGGRVCVCVGGGGGGGLSFHPGYRSLPAVFIWVGGPDVANKFL